MRQNESGRRIFIGVLLAACGLSFGAQANQPLGTDGLTFRDFGSNDNGASFTRGDQMIGGGSTQRETYAKLMGIDREAGAVRVRFDPIKIEMLLPMGWQATEDWERGVAYSLDKRYRVLVWRADFAFEGVKDAEHYAATKVGSIKARRPGVQARARKLPDGTMVIVYENVPGGAAEGGQRTVLDLVMPSPRNPKLGVLMTLGMPTTDGGRGLALLSLLKQGMKIEW